MTTQTLTLSAFLLERIAEDEAVALAATPGPWDTWANAKASYVESVGTLEVPPLPLVRSMRTPDHDADIAHIARNDPARVLAECKAKRAIVEAHPIITGPRILPVDTSGTNYGCETCHALDKTHADSYVEAIGYCDTLRALASVYAADPAWREEWAL